MKNNLDLFVVVFGLFTLIFFYLMFREKESVISISPDFVRVGESWMQPNLK